MTIRDYIINYLDTPTPKGWVNKAIICDDIRELRNEGYTYIESVARELRQMREEGLLAKRKAGKGTEYLLIAKNAVEALETRHTKPLDKITGTTLLEFAQNLRKEKDPNLTLF